MIRIVLVEDQTIVRRGIAGLLATTGDIEVVGEASDGVEALREIREKRPDAVVMDILMPV